MKIKQIQKVAEQKKNLSPAELYVYLKQEGKDIKFGNVLEAVKRSE